MSEHSEANRDNVFRSLEELPAVKRKICELLEQSPNGLTRHEIADALVMPLSSVCGRIKELEGDGWVHSTAETRATQYGKTATVVCITHRSRPIQTEFVFT